MGKQPRAWIVDFDSDAVIDFEDVKSRRSQGGLQRCAEAERSRAGPAVAAYESLKGEADLFELRPKQGACEARPIYARFGSRFVVLAVAATKKDFDRAIVEASDRLRRHR
jgi:hypothetical protein